MQTYSRRYGWWSLLVLPILCTILFSGWSQAGARSLPPKVRVLLMQLSPLLEQQKFGQTIQKIEGWQAKDTLPAPSAMSRSTYHHPELYFVLGNCYLQQKHYQQAVTSYHTQLSGDPEHSYGWLNMAKAQYELQDYLHAAKSFAQGYATAKRKHPQALYYSAASYLMAEHYQQAIAAFEQLNREHAEEFLPAWKEHYIQSLLLADRYTEAIPFIQELIGLYQGDKRVQWQEILLNQYLQHNRLTDASRYVHQLTEESPQTAKWWKAMAHIELQKDAYTNGLAALLIYSFLTPLDADEQQLLADLFLQTGIPVKAAPLYEQYLRDTPDSEMLYRLALAYEQLGQTENALLALEQHPKIKVTYELYLLRGELNYRMERYQQAHADFLHATGCDTKKKGQAWLLAGYAALQMHDLEKSRNALQQAATYSQEKKAAHKALKQLEQAAIAWTDNKEQ